MSVDGNQQDQPLGSNRTFDSLSSTSILSWIYNLQTSPPTSSYIPHLLEKTPTRATKRCRSLETTPSVFLGDGPSFYKRRKALQEIASDMGDKDVARMSAFRVEGSNSDPSRTPSKSNAPSASKNTSSTNPYTPKRQKTSTDEDFIGYKMSLHGLMQDDEAFDKAPDFKDYITDIVISDRGSTMKDASVKRFRNHAKVYKWSNEATFLYHLIPILQGDGYHVATKSVFLPGEEGKHQEEAKDWKDFLADEQIKVTLSKDFTRTLLPSEFSKTPTLIDEIAKDLAKDKDMTNPRPDLTFGLQRERYPLAIKTQISQHLLDLLEITPGIHYAFLIIEGESQSGSSAKAENQARRGGATLVKASRMLRAEVEGETTALPIEGVEKSARGEEIKKTALKAGKLNPITPDYKSFVFSVTMSPTYFSIWVHWFDEGNKLYHMNSVESFAINNSKGPVQIRWALHNIMEWGARTRHPQNETLVKSIEDYIRRDEQRMQAEILAAKEDVMAARVAAKTAKSTVQSAGSASNKRSMPEDAA